MDRHPSIRPMHPGALLREDVLPALGVAKSELAKSMGISRQTLYDILNEQQPVTPEMAVRFGKLFGNGPRFWLDLQRAFDLEAAERAVDVSKIPTLVAADQPRAIYNHAAADFGSEENSAHTNTLDLLRKREMDTVTITREEHRRLLQAAQDLEDIQTVDRALANPQEGLPHEFMLRLIEREHPLTVYREWRGHSKTELSRLSGVNRVQIHDIETRKRGCSVDTLKKLAEALNVQMDDLTE